MFASPADCKSLVTYDGTPRSLSTQSAASRLIEATLFGVSAIDPFSYAAIAIMLVTVATAASLVPARRAAQIDPMNAFRSE